MGNLTKHVDQETHNSRWNSCNVQTSLEPVCKALLGKGGGGGGMFVPSLNFKYNHFAFWEVGHVPGGI